MYHIKLGHKLIFFHSSFLSSIEQCQRTKHQTRWKPHLPEKIAEPGNKQQSPLLRHSPVWSGKNEKLQGTRYEKQFENQVNWIKENNILLNFKCASMKNSTYRPNTAMFPNIMKNPKMISLKGLSQYPIMSLGKIT